MSRRSLSLALAASAALHLLVLGLLLSRGHAGAPGLVPMRVALVTPARVPAGTGAPGAGAAPGTAPTGPPSPVREPSARPGVQAARRPRPDQGPTGEEPPAATAPPAVARLTPVQSDLWVLAAPATPGGTSPAAGTGSPASSPAAGREASAGPGAEGGAGASGAGAGAPGGSGATSLLALLSQRLAWSAERCAPPSLVRLSRHAVPGVPLYFCLDAAGQPSKVGLLGTTGSEQLDRAARDCVVPGALPLPPAPGCYTVEVRFPIRG